MMIEEIKVYVKGCEVRHVGVQAVVKVKDSVSVLNETATKIFEFIYKNHSEGSNISYQDLVLFIRSAFDVGDLNDDEIIEDVKSTIMGLEASGVIAFIAD